jgi:hypothetical protein
MQSNLQFEIFNLSITSSLYRPTTRRRPPALLGPLADPVAHQPPRLAAGHFVARQNDLDCMGSQHEAG